MACLYIATCSWEHPARGLGTVIKYGISGSDSPDGRIAAHRASNPTKGRLPMRLRGSVVSDSEIEVKAVEREVKKFIRSERFQYFGSLNGSFEWLYTPVRDQDDGVRDLILQLVRATYVLRVDRASAWFTCLTDMLDDLRKNPSNPAESYVEGMFRGITGTGRVL